MRLTCAQIKNFETIPPSVEFTIVQWVLRELILKKMYATELSSI